MPNMVDVIKTAERIMCSTVDRGMIDSFCADVIDLLKKQEEKDEKIHTALDGYRMCDEMSKNAYENLTKLIRSERGEVK